MIKKAILLLLFSASMVSGICQPIVYLDFVTHNEETNQWNGTPYYTLNRSKLVSLANYFQTNGITWNMQSDWVYLTNILTQETPALMVLTNNKNILRWMHEDKGVEMDPHAHESQYIYPDVVKLMDSIGLPESKLMGGTIYNDSNGTNIWTNLVNGQYGKIFPTKFWQPDYMMGGGTPNHVADLKYYGVWNPQSTTSYLTHDTTSRLRHLAVGCEMKIKDTTNVVAFVNELKSVVQNVQSGVYPSNGFYLQSIFFEQGDLNNNAFYNKVVQVADSVNAIVATGKAQWKTLKQTYTDWETAYSAQIFQWQCGQMVSVEERGGESGFRVYPNPVTNELWVMSDGLWVDSQTRVKIYNVTGAEVCDLFYSVNNAIDVSNLTPGVYFIQLQSHDAVYRQKLIKE